MCDLFPYFTIIGFQGGVYNHFKRDVVTFHSSWASQAGDQLRSETRTEESVTTALEAGFVGENDDILGGRFVGMIFKMPLFIGRWNIIVIIHQNLHILGGGNSIFYYFHPDPWGRRTHFDTHFFNWVETTN